MPEALEDNARTPGLPSSEEQATLAAVVLAMAPIRYGSITLTVHEGRVVEIASTERIRTRR
jgi:hypothetical protein